MSLVLGKKPRKRPIKLVLNLARVLIKNAPVITCGLFVLGLLELDFSISTPKSYYLLFM